MNSNPTLDFMVDKENNTVTIKRVFAADPELVWEAWTTPAILDQWWAPKPWASKTKSMEFKVGGKRFYAMVGPEGQEHWSIQEYISIRPKTNFKMLNCFADKDENPELPGSEWNITFNGANGMTTVYIEIYNESKERMERMIAMGFKEGFAMALANLDNYLGR